MKDLSWFIKMYTELHGKKFKELLVRVGPVIWL